MKLLLVATTLCWFNAYSQQTNSELLKQLSEKERQLMDAVASGDKSVWDATLHDSCVIGVESGSLTTKSEILKEIVPLVKGCVGMTKVIDPVLKQFGNTAVLTYVADEYLELYHQKMHTQYRQANTWMKFGNDWKIVLMQVFEIPKNPPPISVDPNVLQKYAGTYELSSYRKAFVTVENGKLFVEKSGNKKQLLAQTESVFFRAGDGRVDILFLKDESNGKFKMIERREGEDLVWKQVR